MPYGNSYSLPKPGGVVPLVICNDCYLRQKGVGCKGWGDQDSHAVNVRDEAKFTVYAMLECFKLCPIMLLVCPYHAHAAS